MLPNKIGSINNKWMEKKALMKRIIKKVNLLQLRSYVSILKGFLRRRL